MNEGLLKKIGYWAEYIGAISRWVVDALTSFPRKEKYFGNGIRPTDSTDSKRPGL